MRSRAAPAPRGSARLARARRLGLSAVALGLWSSGTLWLLFHHFFERPGQFGSRPHPLESWWLSLHGAFGLAAIWTFGWLWSAHITKGWATGRQRWSGGLLVVILGGLTVSGYLLYYVGQEQLRALTSLLHWSAGLAAPIPFLLHRLRERDRRRPGPPAARSLPVAAEESQELDPLGQAAP